MKPLVDIIIPVLMPSEYFEVLRSKLCSIPSEMRINFVIDLCLTDRDKVQNIEPIKNERIFFGSFGSPGGARNYALDKCDANFVGFWDVDDEPVPEKILELVQELKESRMDLAIGNWAFINTENVHRGNSPKSVGYSPGIWRFVFRRELIGSTRFESFLWGEDQLFLIQIFLKQPSVYTFNGTVYNYRKHSEGSLTKQVKNVKDLIKVNELWPELTSSLQGRARFCFELMYLKQMYSIVKYARFGSFNKVKLASRFVFSRRNFSIVKTIFNSMKNSQW